MMEGWAWVRRRWKQDGKLQQHRWWVACRCPHPPAQPNKHPHLGLRLQQRLLQRVAQVAQPLHLRLHLPHAAMVVLHPPLLGRDVVARGCGLGLRRRREGEGGRVAQQALGRAAAGRGLERAGGLLDALLLTRGVLAGAARRQRQALGAARVLLRLLLGGRA